VYSVNNNQDGSFLKDLKQKGYLSYDVLEFNETKIEGAGQYSANYMLSLRVTTNEGDVIILSDGSGEYVEEGQENQTAKEISGIVNSNYFYDITQFLADAKSYCLDNKFIEIEGENYNDFTVNEQAIERYFRTFRIKSAPNYKKTFRTEEQIVKGVKLEIERIKNIYKNWLAVNNAIETAKANGKDFLWYAEKNKYDDEGNVLEGQGTILPFGIDLDKLNQDYKDTAKIEDVWYTYTNNPTGEKTTTKGLVMCVFDFKNKQSDLQYESLAFLRYIIQTYSDYIQAEVV
jgi:hypothetical protein